MSASRRSALIDASAEALWRRISDLESWPEWQSVPYATETVSLTAPGPIRSGTEFVMKGRLKSRLFARVTECVPERRLAYEIYRSEYPSDRLTFGRAVITIDLEPQSEGRTRVTCEHRLEGRGLRGKVYAATVMRPFLSTNVQRILDSLAHTSA